MASHNGVKYLPGFNPSDVNACAPEWELYKRDFLIYLDAIGLHDKPGRRKVGMLLSSMGREAIRIYDSFAWTQAVPADEENDIVAVEGEDQHNLDHVFAKFDRHFGVHYYRNIKRQEFLNTKRANSTIMDFIADLRRKAERCEYGTQKESLICDMIINGVNDSKCSEKLMEIPTDALTLEKVMQTCRQVELTAAHLKTLEKNKEDTKIHHASAGYKTRRQQYSYGNGYSRRPFHQGYAGKNPYCEKCCKHHKPHNCPAYNKICISCGEKGHFKISKICPGNRSYSRGRSRMRDTAVRRSFRGNRSAPSERRRVYYADGPTERDYDDEEYLSEMFDQCTTEDVFTAKTNKHNSDTDWVANLKVKDKDLLVELDSGARCNILSENTAKTFQNVSEIKPSDLIINGIGSRPMKSRGKIVLPCRYKDTKRNLEFEILETNNINLLGRTDCVELGLIARVHTTQVELNDILDSYNDVLGDEIGCIPGEYDIQIDPDVIPVVHAPRPVPAPIRGQLKAELDNLVKCNIIKPVTEPTQWVNSMVCVRKKTGRVRICIDPSDLNKAIRREHFPMNGIDEIITRLHGSKYFSTLDANMGYYQIKLSEKSSYLTTFNTPFGRYRYLRMPMGAKCSSEVFQREMVHHFGGFEGTEIVVDDILVHGKTVAEHNERLKAVLEKARSINLKLNKSKCVFQKPEVNYVGHKITGDGVKPTEQRVKSIVEMRDPENHNELDTILGMLAYVSKFIPNLSSLNAPLREIRKQEEWSWTEKAKKAFQDVKNTLTSTTVLKYFDVKKPVRVTVDASMKGLGAALLQEDGVVAYASRALSETEQRYAQIEKEMLGVVFGCERFHKMLYGKSDVTIETDHKPLESIVRKPIHTAPMRIQRMLLKLQPYEFNLVHVKGKELGLADCLSRLPLKEIGNKVMDDEMMILTVDTLTHLNFHNIRKATNDDAEFQEVKRMIFNGWPENKDDVPEKAIPYWDYREEMSAYNGVVYKGERTCIPEKLRSETLKVIHSSHMGMVKCKQRARELVFWPGMNKQIEDTVSRCSACLAYRNKPAKEPMIIHPLPSLPWSKVGTDLFEIEGKHYLVMVDYYSNFIEVSQLERDTTTKTVIKHLKENIARYGIMDTLMSDNGPQFTSSEFAEFTNSYNIRHITSSPGHQQSNGLAEKAVQTVKNMIRKCSSSGNDIYLALLDLRNAPRDNIGSPMQRLMGRRGRTLLPMTENMRKPVQPSTAEEVSSKLLGYREYQKHYYDRGSKQRPDLKQGDAVRVFDKTWKPAELVRKTEYPRSYIIKAGDQAKEYRRNTDRILKTNEQPHVINPKETNVPMIPFDDSRATYAHRKPVLSKPMQPVSEAVPAVTKETVSKPVISTETIVKSRSGRVIRRPRHLENFVPG